MSAGLKIKVLVVDDSRIFRQIMTKALAEAEDMEVVAAVASGEQALEYVRQHPVDIVTLDVEMPGMGGLETLAALQALATAPKGPPRLGVIMVSSHTHKGADTTIRALEAGAFDFVTKPDSPEMAANLGALRRQLLVKMRCFASRKHIAKLHTGAARPVSPGPAPATIAPTVKGVQAIVIGVSTGGPRALSTLVPGLCKETDLPILIVQHMPPAFTKSLAESLDRQSGHLVQEAWDGQPVQSGQVFIAPGGRHMVVRKEGSGGVVIGLNDLPPENGCRPSVDVLFRAAAALYGGRALALILTGMGHDGVKGLGTLKRAGAYVIGQDEASSVVWGMPGSAVAAGVVDQVLPLEKIAGAVGTVVRK